MQHIFLKDGAVFEFIDNETETKIGQKLFFCKKIQKLMKLFERLKVIYSKNKVFVKRRNFFLLKRCLPASFQMPAHTLKGLYHKSYLYGAIVSWCVCHCQTLFPNLIFERLKSTLMVPCYGIYSKNRLVAIANFRLGCKWLKSASLLVIVKNY